MLACVSRSVTHRIHACGAVYDFGQNEPGWCELRITGQAGLNVQLRHAELLQHPPFGPEDGSICESHHVPIDAGSSSKAKISELV